MACGIQRTCFISVIVIFLILGQGDCDSSTIKKITDKDGVIFYNATEGDVFNVVCNTTFTSGVHWENADGFYRDGKILSFLFTKKSDANYYECYHKTIFKTTKLETIYVNVQYPAKLHHVSKHTEPLHENMTYILHVEASGNPGPNTTLASRADGAVVYQRGGEGTFNISVGPLRCADGGTYTLKSENVIGHDSFEEEILVFCPPALSPRVPIHDLLQPRLGDKVELKVITVGYPFPVYNWTFDGKELSSDDKHFQSDVNLGHFSPEEFGDYTLTIANDLGETNHTFKVTASGPPGPVTELTVTDIGETSVNLTWLSGYDYGHHENFIVKSYKNGTYKDIARFDAKDGDHGFNPVNQVIMNLEKESMYNLSVMTNSSQGQGDVSSLSVVFETGHYNLLEVVEGVGVFVECNDTLPGDRVYWTRDGQLFQEGKQLKIFNTTRDQAGHYFCNEVYKSSIIIQESVSIVVQYPATIPDLKVVSEDVNVNGTYVITLDVEGNPVPMTTIHQNGKVLFQTNRTGVFNASVNHVTCSEFGEIQLTCSNRLGNETKTEKILVHCPPAPKSSPKTTLKPRLGENIALKIDSIGYPYPVYTWSMNGMVLKNETAKNEDEYDVNNTEIKDFGVYELTMANDLGTSTVNYKVLADGPPEPVTDIAVNNVSTTSVNITFVSGFDYGASQTFIVQSFDGKTYKDIASFDDISVDHLPRNVSQVITSLSFGTIYNLTILSNNSRGMSQRSSDFVLFTTKVPNGNYEVVEGTNVTIACNGSTNLTDVHWENDAGKIVSDRSVLELVHIAREETGHYECYGKLGASLRSLEKVFIDVQYPAKILNMSVSENYLHANDSFYIELHVEGNPAPNITFTKLRDGSLVFSNIENGTVNITMDPVQCTDLGKYKLSCSNKIGTEMKDEELYVYCPPVVDPKAHITKTFYPRLGNLTTVQIENYGYPYPNYTWTYKNKPLPHKDADMESHITVDVSVESFGDYTVDMDNEFGDISVTFNVVAKGPPEPVSGLTMDNVTYDTVTLNWVSGFDYGSPQIFMVMTLDGKSLMNFTDKSAGLGASGAYTVSGLDSSTSYKLTVVSHNKDGNSNMPAGNVEFSTAAAPSPQTGNNTDKKAIIGGVLGGVCFLAIIIVVAIFLRRRRQRLQNYEDLDEDDDYTR